MFQGEFHSLHKMHSLMPTLCPKPHGWGEYQNTAGTFFLVMDFLHLTTKSPDPVGTARLVSSLHKKTYGTSPNMLFGFDVPTWHGKIVQPNTWDANWSEFFTKLITIFYNEDMKANGHFPEYETAFMAIKDRVIPRLLGALQSDGRVLIPYLVHGDLWHKSIGTREATGEPILYDPASFYGHNEFDMGMWRTTFVPFDEEYRKNYKTSFPPSEPKEEWDDRNRLYSLFFHMSHSAHWIPTARDTRLR